MSLVVQIPLCEVSNVGNLVVFTLFLAANLSANVMVYGSLASMIALALLGLMGLGPMG